MENTAASLRDGGRFVVKHTFIEVVEDSSPRNDLHDKPFLRFRAHSDPVLYEKCQESPRSACQEDAAIDDSIEFDLTGLSDVDTETEADKAALPCYGHIDSTPRSDESACSDHCSGSRFSQGGRPQASSATSSNDEQITLDGSAPSPDADVGAGTSAEGSGQAAECGNWQDIAGILRENARLALENKLLRENARLVEENASLQAKVQVPSSVVADSNIDCTVVPAPWMEAASSVMPMQPMAQTAQENPSVPPGTWLVSMGYQMGEMDAHTGWAAPCDGAMWCQGPFENVMDYKASEPAGSRRRRRQAAGKAAAQFRVPEAGTSDGPPVEGGDDKRTTVMLRNLPNNYTREMLLAMLDSEGFSGQYDFIYLPIDFKTQACLGYAFVNLSESAVVPNFWAKFDGFSSWVLPSKKVCGVTWSGPHQGREAHVDRYRNSPVMHASVPDHYKPLVFEDGKITEFPGSTKAPRAPRTRNYATAPGHRAHWSSTATGNFKVVLNNEAAAA